MTAAILGILVFSQPCSLSPLTSRVLISERILTFQFYAAIFPSSTLPITLSTLYFFHGMHIQNTLLISLFTVCLYLCLCYNVSS